MGFEIGNIFSEILPQVIKVLTIVALGIGISAFLTQGAGRAITAILSVIIIIVLFIALEYAYPIAKSIFDKIYTGDKTPAASGVDMIRFTIAMINPKWTGW